MLIKLLGRRVGEFLQTALQRVFVVRAVTEIIALKADVVLPRFFKDRIQFAEGTDVTDRPGNCAGIRIPGILLDPLHRGQDLLFSGGRGLTGAVLRHQLTERGHAEHGLPERKLFPFIHRTS